VEWPEKGHGVLPAADISLTIAYHGEARELDVAACTANGGKILANIL
jgi:tRNA threonylcarbamoyladenosine biosynthesis protein TsaE